MIDFNTMFNNSIQGTIPDGDKPYLLLDSQNDYKLIKQFSSWDLAHQELRIANNQEPKKRYYLKLLHNNPYFT